MAKKIRTSVDLTDAAQQVKEAFGYLGLKNILSAGLILFAKQSADGKLAAIAAAVNQKPIKPIETKAKHSKSKSLKAAINIIKEHVGGGSEGGTTYKLLTEQEKAELAELRRLLGPEPKHTKKAK